MIRRCIKRVRFTQFLLLRPKHTRNGAEHYFSHVRDPDRVSIANFSSGLDYRMGADAAVNWAQAAEQTYSANDFSARAKQIVADHDPSTGPLFLYLPFQSVHSPYEVPKAYEQAMAKYSQRGVYAGMVYALDEAIGYVRRVRWFHFRAHRLTTKPKQKNGAYLAM